MDNFCGISQFNYTSNYTVNQLILPLEVGVVIAKDDPMWTFLRVMEGVPMTNLFRHTVSGRQEYDPRMMMHLVLFAYMNQIYSLRKMEEVCRTDLRFIFLSRGAQPSHMAFQRFISEGLATKIDTLFADVVKTLVEMESIDTDVLYLDGTKIEANANKFTFVWKKAVEGYRTHLYAKIDQEIQMYAEAENDASILNYQRSTYTAYDVKEIRQRTWTELGNQPLVNGKGTRKSPKQRRYEAFSAFHEKLKEYEAKIACCGEDRNSYSKTDPDATFMHMKEDYYMKTGIFKPGYNLQIGVSDEYILALAVSQHRSDARTFIPLMEAVQQTLGHYPLTPVADAGYGFYENYRFCEDHGMELYLKYPHFALDNAKPTAKQRYRARTWEKTEDGNLRCPEGRLLEAQPILATASGRPSQSFVCSSCEGCLQKSNCTKSSGNRSVTVNPKLVEYEQIARTNLQSPAGIQHRMNRSIQAEGAFGILKQNYGMDRFHRRGLKNVENEAKLVAIGFNLMKFHQKSFRISPS
jgi:transposase